MKKKLFAIALTAFICAVALWPVKSAVLTQQSNPTGLVVLVAGSTVAGNGSISFSSAASAALTAVPNIFINNGNGNVGIKTAAPTQDLDVNADLRVRDVATIEGAATVAGTLTAQSSATVNGVLLAAGNLTVGSGGTPITVLSTGTWGPVMTTTTNLDAAAIVSSPTFVRMGNVVQAFGTFTADPTSATATRLHMSLPIASAFTVAADAGGTFSSTLAGTTGNCIADISGDRFEFTWTAEETANNTYGFSCSYVIK